MDQPLVKSILIEFYAWIERLIHIDKVLRDIVSLIYIYIYIAYFLIP